MDTYLAQFEGLLLAASEASAATAATATAATAATAAATATAATAAATATATAAEATATATAAAEAEAEATATAATEATATAAAEAEAEEAEEAEEAAGIGFVIDMGTLRMSDSIALLQWIPQQIDFIQRLHRNTHLVGAIRATAIVMRSDIARRVVTAVLGAVTLQRPYAAVASRRAGDEWIRRLGGGGK